MRVLYLYSGERKKKFQGKINIDYPDTQFYGLNHLKEFGIEAEYKEPGAGFLGFKIKHFLAYFETSGYDIVFGASILFMMVFKKIFRPKRKFVLFNTGLFRTIAANKGKKLRLRLIRYLLSGIGAIACLSRRSMEYLSNEIPEIKEKLYYVPLGVDTEYYKPKYDGRKNYILSGGRDNGRDYKTVVEVARLMPEEEFHIFCSRRNMKGVGDIPKNVKINYEMPPSKVNVEYHEAKLLLLLTHDDSFLDSADCSGQTVLLDAMASGLPVVASRKKYLKDYAEEGEDILCADFYDPKDAMKKIKMLDDAALREKLARSARVKTEKLFSTRKMAENLVGLFNKVLYGQ